MVKTFGGAYSGKRVLVTGHTGFKGGWLSLWLHELGAEVYGLSLPPPEGDNLFSIFPTHLFKASWLQNLCEPEAFDEAIEQSRPDLIFHLAAQPLVGVSHREPIA